MKKLLSIFTVLLITITSFTSCNKNDDVYDPTAQLAIEKPIIEAYVKKNYPNAQMDERTGIWYDIIESAEGQEYEYQIKDTLNQKMIFSETLVNYTGRLVSNGSIFDQTKDLEKGSELQISMNLNRGQGSVITAWLLAFYPKKVKINGEDINLGIIFENGAQPGDKFRIITPSLYAYGNRANGTIPANSPLDFEIEVREMKDVVFENK